MEENSLEKLIKKKFDKGIFRRWICLLLAIIMVIPVWGGVLAADVDVDLVNEAYKEIILWKTDISQFRSAIWWTKDGGTKGIDHPIYDEDARTTAFFLSALMEKLNISHTFKANDKNIASDLYTVTATVLGEKYEITIEGTTGETWKSNGNEIWVDIPTDEDAEKLQYQYEINILLEEIEAGLEEKLKNLQSEITDSTATTDPKHAKVTSEKLKEIKAKAVVYGKEIKGYENKIINITLKAIGVGGLEFTNIDEKISELQGILADIEAKVFARDSELDSEAKKNTKLALKTEVDEISTSIGGILGQLDSILTKLSTTPTLKELEEIKVRLDAYERQVDSYGNRFGEIEKLAQGLLDIEPEINFTDIKQKNTSAKDKIEDANVKLNNQLPTARIADAEAKVKKAEKDKTNADVTAAKKAVAFLEDETEKANFTNRIAYVEQVIKAIAAVDKAVKSKKADDYGVADALVNRTGYPKVDGLDDDTGTAPFDVKNGLNGKLTELKVIIDADAHKKAVADASKLITLAEGNLTKYLNGTIDQATMAKSKEDANTKVDALDAGDDKDNLSRRLIIVNNRYTELDTAMTAVKSAVDTIEMKFIEGKVDQEDVTNDNVTTINFGSTAYKDAVDAGKKANAIGKALNTRIVEINKVLDAIELAKGLNRNTLKTVKTAVAKINTNFSKVKNALNEMIIDLENDIANDNSESLLNAAFTAVTTDQDKDNNAVTSTEIAALIKAAKTLIGKEIDKIEKIKLTAVINAIETAQKSKEAVALAGATKLRKDFDKADSLVKSISEDDLGYITGHSKNLIGLKNELNNKLGDLLKIINLAEATAAVVKAENSLNQKDYDLAFTAIGKVEGDIDDSTTDKYELKKRLDIVKSVIDATNSLAKAVSAVGEAAKLSKDLDNSEKIAAAKATITNATNTIDRIDENGKYKINRETMNTTVKDLENIYIFAIDAVKSLSDVQQKSDTTDVDYKVALDEAKAEVGKVTDSKVRSDLEAGITAIEARRNAAGTINNAEEKLVAAEMMLNNLLLGDDMKFDPDKPIMELEEPEEFEEKIEEIKKAITEADTEIKKVKDKRATEFKNRLLAVTTAKDVAILIAKAEGNVPPVKAEVDAATKALPKVKEDIIKDGEGKTIIINHKEIKAYFEARVKYLNATLVKAQQFAEAKKLTDKAYETLAEGDIKKAIEYVAKMENIKDKSKFNKGVTESPRIFGIDTILGKFASEKVEKNINDAISGLQMDLKSGAKPVGEAKKSTDVFSNLVKLADSRLGKDSLEPPTDLIEYAKDYENKILVYNTNNAALAKAQQVWQQIAKADKSKSISDIEMLDIEFGLLAGIVEGTGKFKDQYEKGLLASLQGEINRINNYKTNEDKKKKDADDAIVAVIATLKNYTDAENAEGKKIAREQLPVDIGKVRTAVAKIDASDKTAHKEYNAKIALMELYRDAINKINRAQISCTPANVKDAKAAVDKVDKAKDNGDYIFVNVVLVREIDELYERLVNEESAGKAKILVDKAWETKSQTDFDAANNAVTRLPENNETQIKIKEDLQKSLNELKIIIDKLDETDREAVSNTEKALKEALTLIYESKIQEVDPTEKQINDAYAKLTGRGIDGGSYEDTDGTHFAEYYIKQAKDSTNKIVRDLDGKNALLEIIAEREHLFKVYSEEILIKEARRLIVKADASVILRNSMPKDTEEERKAWEAQRVIANGDLDSAAIAIKRINLPENFEARQRLLERLNLITKDLNTGTTTDKIAYINGLLREATKKVSEARDVFEKGDVGGNLMALLTDAKNLVGDIEIEIEMLIVTNESEQSAKDKLKELVAALRQNLINIENGISDKDLIANAEKAIKAAEDRVKKKEYEIAKVDIMEAEMNTEQISDTNAIKRNELRSKINKLKNEIAEATGGEETPPLDDQNDAKVVAKALQLYYKAKASLLQKDIDAARKYINENMVHNTTLKQWLLARLAELEKMIVGINKPGDIEEAKRKEEEAKKKAEEARKKKYPGIDDALNSKDRDKNNPDAKWGKENEFKKK